MRIPNFEKAPFHSDCVRILTISKQSAYVCYYAKGACRSTHLTAPTVKAMGGRSKCSTAQTSRGRRLQFRPGERGK